MDRSEPHLADGNSSLCEGLHKSCAEDAMQQSQKPAERAMTLGGGINK
jgi:hypothetical protein